MSRCTIRHAYLDHAEALRKKSHCQVAACDEGNTASYGCLDPSEVQLLISVGQSVNSWFKVFSFRERERVILFTFIYVCLCACVSLDEDDST